MLKRLRQYQEEGWTYKEVCDAEGLKCAQLSRIRQRYNIGKFVKEYPNHSGPNDWNEEEKYKLLIAAKRRDTFEEASKIIGRTPNAIKLYAFRNCIKGLRYGIGLRKKPIRKIWTFCVLWKLYSYRKAGHSFFECSALLRKSRNSIAGAVGRDFHVFNAPCRFLPPTIRASSSGAPRERHS